jgi:D-lactate dehydrogenase (cytochrome)
LDDPDVLDHIRTAIGDDHLLTGPAAIPYATDVYTLIGTPAAVARPGTVAELQDVVRACASAARAIQVRGGGASYSDGYQSPDAGYVLLDLSRLNRIETIDTYGGYVTVEAGVTWAALSEALAQQGFRTPFRGPFSGLVATVGGSVSQNSISHGSGLYGISAESVLALDIVTADGELLRTGAGAVGGAPFARHYGPDLTGLFTGDCGAFGIKARITLPILRQRPIHGVVSFSFPDFAATHESMRRIALERIEDSHFALDAALSQGQIARQERAGTSLAMALSILRTSPSLVAGVRQVLAAGLLARRQIRASAYMTHYIVEGFDQAEVNARLHRLRQLVVGLGSEIAPTVAAVVRGMPFAPLFNTLGPMGERWVPLHGILPHANVAAFHTALDAFYAARRADMKRLGVWTGGMFSAVGTSGFLYEIAIYWPDAITDYHRAVVPADYLAALPAYPDDPAARDYVRQLKADLTALYATHGAVNFQVGKAYPYLDRVAAPVRGLVQAIKARLDPDRRIAPGNLGL